MALSDRLNLTSLREAVEERTGFRLETAERLEILEARSQELGATRRELDVLGWTALDYVGGSPQELKAVERRKLAQKARIVWMKDAQAGAAVDLMNDFVLGRGLTKPKCADEEVQKVVDEAWEDPDDQIVLTAYQSQLALNTDLTLQSNLFVLVFDDGDDGRVKLGLLEHDAVENVVRDPENRLRVMYFVARHFKHEWDFENDGPKVDLFGRGGTADAKNGDDGKGEVRYYKHWRNVEDAEQDAMDGMREVPEGPPEYKMGDGKVFHVAFNRTSEMAFGHPTFDRLLRWFDAYNTFMAARMDIMQARAAFVMKRKVEGTPAQLPEARAAGGVAAQRPGRFGERPGRRAVGAEAGQHPERERGRHARGDEPRHGRGQRDSGRSDASRAGQRGDAVPAVVLRRLVFVEPGDGDVARASGAEGGGVAAGVHRGDRPVLRRPGDRARGGQRADLI